MLADSNGKPREFFLELFRRAWIDKTNNALFAGFPGRLRCCGTRASHFDGARDAVGKWPSAARPRTFEIVASLRCKHWI
jgi:hypothetical protein